jgi:two-component sensor histidine kinase/6-pyruvoyl-tetrahydropterin synthase
LEGQGDQFFKHSTTLLDSLIEYNQFDKAEELADSLYLLINAQKDKKKYLGFMLEMRLKKAIILDNKYEHKQALEILLSIVDQAIINDFYKIACISNIKIAAVYEKLKNWDLSYLYWDDAQRLYERYNLEEIYSTLIIRKAVQLRFQKKLDSAIYYAFKSKEYAEKYKNHKDEMAANIFIGILLKKCGREVEAVPYFLEAIKYNLKTSGYDGIAVQYANIAECYLQLGDFNKALSYSDSSFLYYDMCSFYYKHSIPQVKSIVYDSLKNADSAYYYFRLYHKDYTEYIQKHDAIEAGKITEQYEAEKKGAIIKSRNQQLIMISIIAVVIGVASFFIFLQNKKIRNQNTLIQLQMDKLQKLLNQKNVLLSELQHRVKNNLQQVISILEIQKESIDFNNIDELVRENLNRIHSMALLHRKLSVAEDINSIYLSEYLNDLATLVKESYFTPNKKITIVTTSNLGNINIETALPLGFIVVELISNSIKHAFAGKKEGLITIAAEKDVKSGKQKLYFADNGSGFDFNPQKVRGLGIEIIKGLVGQLNGEIEVQRNEGFQIAIYF